MRDARELRVEVVTPSPYRVPRFGGIDRLTQIRDGVVHRLVHHGEHAVHVRVASLDAHRVLFGARSRDPHAAGWAIERMRLALGVDHDLTDFYARFAFDPLIGAAVRRDPGLRVLGRPHPFESLAFAICEQLIESERAAAIQRRLIARFGRRCADSGLSDSPEAGVIAAQAPALLRSLDLSEGRAIALIRAAREVASGRVDLFAAEPRDGWRRLRAIPGIGSWTLQYMALCGQGRLDQIPAGDLSYVKLVGRLTTGDPYGRATEDEVQEFFAPYAPYAGLAGAYALRSRAVTPPPSAAVRPAAIRSRVVTL